MLAEYRKRPQGLPDLLNLFALVADGVVLGKDGSLLSSWWYAGPDMESATENEMAVLSGQMNAALVGLGNGWMIQADALRRPAVGYPDEGAFPDPTTRLLDAERRAFYTSGEATYESRYALTVTYLPPPDVQAKVGDFFVEGEKAERRGHELVLRAFERHRDQLEDALSDRLALSRMDSEALLAFLAHSVTGLAHPVRVPPVPVDLDFLLGSQDLVLGFEPRIGRLHVRPIAITGFPGETFPGILDFLNRLPLDYRWSTRFIPLDPATATARLRAIRRNWWQKRQGLAGMVKEALNHGGSTFGDRDAVRMAEDADDAITEASSGAVRFGYYTSVLLLLGEEPDAVEAGARQVMRELQHHGFASRVETINAGEAYLGSIPGHGYRNVRRPLLHTLNLADLLPTTSVFPGLEANPCSFYPHGSPPVFFAETSGSTPFRFHLHVSDVGHAMVIGPTGAGKSTLVGLLLAQFFRFPGARAFAFDKGLSSYVLCCAAGGDHYEIAGENEALAFCPLAQVDDPAERRWAAEWLEALLTLQGIPVLPRHQKALHTALERLAHGEGRTLTDFAGTVQDQEIRDGLRHYTLEGAMGALLDADHDGLRHGRFQVFEMEHLMNLGEKNVIPVLLYLFHRLEQRLTGAPSLLVLEEAWLLLGHPVFAEKIEEWLRVLRKRNCAVVFVSQNLSEVEASPCRDLLLESCPTKIFLPNPEARTEQSAALYRKVGLNERQIEIIATATPKRHYYVVSPLGRRLIDPALGPLALAFVGASGSEDIARARTLAERDGDGWVPAWLRERGLAAWAERWSEITGGGHAEGSS